MRSANYRMTGDVTLQEAVTPITGFSGTFDGDNHAITGYRNNGVINIAEEDDPESVDTYTALFAELDGGALKNVHFENYDISFPEGTGGYHVYGSVAVGTLSNGGTIENVIIGDGEIVSPTRAAGIVSKLEGGTAERPNRIINSVNNADVTSEYPVDDANPTYGTAGGIVSILGGSVYAEISGCTNNGTVTGYCAGGIFGDKQNPNGSITGCINTGNIRGTAFAGGIGGDAWWGGSIIIDGCVNKGRIESWKTYNEINDGTYADANLGGILGMGGIGGSVTIKNSSNTGAVVNEIDNVLTGLGGILGTFTFTVGQNNELYIENCRSDGTITSNAPYTAAGLEKNRYAQGGIVGYLKTESNTEITDSAGSDDVTLPEGHVYGSIAGCVSTMGTGKTHSFNFTEITDIDAPFGIIYQNRNNPYSYEFKNMRTDVLRHGGAPNKEENSAGTFDLSGSEITELIRINTSAAGNSGPGEIILVNGAVETLVIYPDGAWPSGSNPRPEYTLQGTALEKWKNPTYNDSTGQGREFIINDEVLTGTEGTLNM